jgi:hypothetical protein
VKADWFTIRWMLSYKAGVGEPLNPRNSTRRCSRCGGMNKAPKGAVFECGLGVERQLNAAVNLYLQMEGLPHDPEWFDKVVGGFALTGEEADEGSNEPWRSPRLLNPKSYICLPKTHSSEPISLFPLGEVNSSSLVICWVLLTKSLSLLF